MDKLNQMKLKDGIGAFYATLTGNGLDVLYSLCIIHNLQWHKINGIPTENCCLDRQQTFISSHLHECSTATASHRQRGKRWRNSQKNIIS